MSAPPMQHIRFATIKDVKQIAALHLAAWQESYGHIISQTILNSLTLEEKINDWQHWLGKPTFGSTTLVLEENEHIIAYISFGPSRDNNATKVDGEIYAIYMYSDYKRKKFGTLLLKEALTKLAKSDFKHITVWVLKDNIAAQNFYQALGFTCNHKTKIETFKDISLEEVQYQKRLI